MDWWWMKREKWRSVRRLYPHYLDLLQRLIEQGQRRGFCSGGSSHQLALSLSGIMMQLTRDWLSTRRMSL